MRTSRSLLVVGGVGLALVAVIAAGGAWASRPGTPVAIGPGEARIVLTVHHSRFTPERIQVRAGTDVRFVVDNSDPIGHELIIGDEDVHRRHEDGTEPHHEPRPGEVSIPALGQAETTFRFDSVGEVRFACHLPGHLAYGMEGFVQVVA